MQLARLLRVLGNENNFNMVYTPDKSVANTTDYAKPFVNMGYKTPTRDNFSETKALSTLNGGNPVFIYGVDENDEMYSWVLDGVYSITYTLTNISGANPEKKYFLHCVWGNNGNGNGYFSFAGNKVGGWPQTTAPGDIRDEQEDTFRNMTILYGFSKK